MRKSVLLLGTLAATLAATCTVSGQSSFVDVASSKGLSVLSGQYLHGGAWGDVNGDGYPDLFTGAFGAAEGVNRLFISNGAGFTESVQGSINVSNGRTSGGAIADFDNDGRKDLIVMNNRRSSNPGLNQLLRNMGAGLFTDVTSGSNINQSYMSSRNSFVLDYNGDGLLDVILQNDMWGTSGYKKSKLMRNTGNMTFTDATGSAGLPISDGVLVGLGGAAGDVNGDSWPDFINVGSDPGNNYLPRIKLYINNRNGTFSEATNFNFSSTMPWYGNNEDWPAGAAIGDLDGDGDMDMVIGEHYGSAHYGAQRVSVRVYRNDGNDPQGNPTWTDVTTASNVPALYSKQPHVEIKDFDNDGKNDIWVSVTMNDGSDVAQPYVLTNTGNSGGVPQFAPPAGVDPPTTYEGYHPTTRETYNPRYFPAAPTGDYNGDGKPDIFGVEAFDATHDPPLFENTTANAGNYLDVQVDTATPGENRNGIGATVKLFAPGHMGEPAYLLGVGLIETGNGFSCGADSVAHFGLGGEGSVDVMVIMPADGSIYTVTGVAANQLVTIPEPASLLLLGLGGLVVMRRKPK